MITEEPDRSLGLARLEREFIGFRDEASTQESWYFRESYIDRLALDPFYILAFKTNVDDQGDDLYDQELFGTPYSCLRGVCLTREAKGPGGNYWRPVSKNALLRRLDHFMSMYKENYLQPPGYKGDHINPEYVHERFYKKRFLFEIRSPQKGIIGIGPKMFAGIADAGALCGQVTDEEGNPLDGVTVEIFSNEAAYSRLTRDGGLFWFSRVPNGDYKICVKEYRCLVQVLKNDEFGNIKGWFFDREGNPIENGKLQFKAPDDDIFNAHTNFTGKFTTGPLPAFPVQNSPFSKYPYIMKVPSFMFSTQKSVTVSDAVIGGTLHDERGIVLPGMSVILKQGDKKIAETMSDGAGIFRFTGLLGGRYQLAVAGSDIMLILGLGGGLDGNIKGIPKSANLELIVANKVVTTERTNRTGIFSFENAAPGNYTLSIKKPRLQN